MQSKVIFAVFAFAAILSLSLADDDYHPCTSDNHCDHDECCVATPYGPGKACRDIPDDFGEICGGPYACPRCGDWRTCNPITPGTVVDRVSVTGRCGRKNWLGRR